MFLYAEDCFYWAIYGPLKAVEEPVSNSSRKEGKMIRRNRSTCIHQHRYTDWEVLFFFIIYPYKITTSENTIKTVNLVFTQNIFKKSYKPAQIFSSFPFSLNLKFILKEKYSLVNTRGKCVLGSRR